MVSFNMNVKLFKLRRFLTYLLCIAFVLCYLSPVNNCMLHSIQGWPEMPHKFQYTMSVHAALVKQEMHSESTNLCRSGGSDFGL